MHPTGNPEVTTKGPLRKRVSRFSPRQTRGRSCAAESTKVSVKAFSGEQEYQKPEKKVNAEPRDTHKLKDVKREEQKAVKKETQ